MNALAPRTIGPAEPYREVRMQMAVTLEKLAVAYDTLSQTIIDRMNAEHTGPAVKVFAPLHIACDLALASALQLCAFVADDEIDDVFDQLEHAAMSIANLLMQIRALDRCL